MRACLAYFTHSVWRLVAAVALSVAQTLVLLPIPFLLLYAFDRGIPAQNYWALIGVGLAMIALQCLSALISVRARSITLGLVKGAVFEIRQALVVNWFALPRGRYAAIEPAARHTLLVHDTERLDVMATAALLHVLPTGVLVVGIVGILFWLSPVLTFTTATLVPLAVVVSHRLRRRLREATRMFHVSFEQFNRGAWLALESTDLTKIQAAEHAEIERQRRMLDNLRQRSLDITALQWTVTTGHSTLTVVIGGMILIVGGTLLAQGALTLGELMSFYGALAMLRSSASLAITAVPHIVEGREAAERVGAALVDRSAPVYSGTKALQFRGDLRFEAVTFGYEGRAPLFRDVTFHVGPGEVVGIAGESGTGKTTLVMLLLGLYRPLDGRIRFDDEPIDGLDMSALRRQIGTMPQDPLILPDTVTANIAFGLDESAELAARVRDAGDLAGLDEFARALPEGYDTVLGTRGINLSGGQRQRIALARALVRRPRLLILDEPTNHLGTSTVTQVLAAVARWPAPPTVLVISHDPELLAQLPRVLELANGQLSRRSRHAHALRM